MAVSAVPLVYLVGAGPGDPDLLTVKAARLLQSADVLVYDRLVAPEILELVPVGATRIYVGKATGQHHMSQDEINDLLVRVARPGRTVVRLKGGDPLIFGRGCEEIEHLARHDVAVEVVPGITSASGCAAYASIPLTHRGHATGVRFVTGHCCRGDELSLDWQSLADPDTTLVVYMGLANIGTIAARLIEAGLPGSTPVAVVANGTTPKQRVCRAPLAAIADAVATARIEPPAVIVIGRVVAAMDALGDDVRPGIGDGDPETRLERHA